MIEPAAKTTDGIVLQQFRVTRCTRSLLAVEGEGVKSAKLAVASEIRNPNVCYITLTGPTTLFSGRNHSESNVSASDARLDVVASAHNIINCAVQQKGVRCQFPWTF